MHLSQNYNKNFNTSFQKQRLRADINIVFEIIHHNRVQCAVNEMSCSIIVYEIKLMQQLLKMKSMQFLRHEKNFFVTAKFRENKIWEKSF